MNKLIKQYHVKSTNDFKNIPNYCYDINPSVEPLKTIVDTYNLNFEVQCGLSSCHTWHKDGVIVELENGKLTNVGHVCGEKFGEKFQIEQKIYQEKILKPQAIIAINDFKKLVPTLASRLNLIKEQTETLLNRKLNFNCLFPNTYKELVRRANTSDYSVTQQTQRSNEEVEALKAINPYQNLEALKFKEVRVGELAGLNLFNYNFSEKVNIRLISTFDYIKNIDIGIENFSSLISLQSWVENFDSFILEAELNISSAQKFFQHENYKFLTLITNQKIESKGLKELDTDKLDEAFKSKAVYENTIKNKTLNRKERRRMQFSSNSSFYKKSA